ncbi:MAG TPA: amidase domain-containing protein [Microbacteriaceae bacterium]|nr:amidase domain-containing protein [Microbacteriaceae bacterium]
MERPEAAISRRTMLLSVLAGSGALALAGCTAAARGPVGRGPATRATSQKTRASASPTARPTLRLPSRPGDVLGGSVTLTGTGLAAVTAVRFAAAEATIASTTATSVAVTIPAALDYQPATVPVTLVTPAGTFAAGGYTYAALTPVGRQMAYALKYWKHYNTARYGSLNSVGGDCANFASQTLVARGWAMNDTWYNHDAAEHWTPAWGYVPAMDDYFLSHGAALGLERLAEDQRDRVARGDLGVFDWENNGDRDHVEVVDRITRTDDGTIKVALASHNLDYAYRDLDETITKQHPGATMHFWHFIDPTAVGGLAA